MKNLNANVQSKSDSVKLNSLKLNSEKIVKVSDEDAELIGGGSTCSTLTCTWCTSTQKSGKAESN